VLRSVPIVVFLIAIAIANLPDSATKRNLMEVDGPLLTAVGAKQVWSVFAPDPSQVTIETEVRFRYADGSSGSWRIEKRNPVVGSYRDYRWLKLGENAELEQAGAGLVDWAVRNRAGRRPVVRATLVRRVRPIAPPGRATGDHLPFRTDVLLVATYRAGG
jgi:hypothetical protein